MYSPQIDEIQLNSGKIINGEAAESDDEDNDFEAAASSSSSFQQQQSLPHQKQQQPQQKIDQQYTKWNPFDLKDESLNEQKNNDVSSLVCRPINNENSILHVKLVERNISLWQNLNQFIQTTFLSTSKDIIGADKFLVQSQLSLQTASKTIKKVDEIVKQIVQKSKNISSSFLPDIRFN